MVGTRLCRPGEFEESGAETRPADGRGPSRVGVRLDRGGRLQQNTLHHTDFGLRGDAVLDERHEVARLHLGLAGHLPGGRPHERAWHRVGDVADACGGGLERFGVEAHRRVREVVVVEQNQFSARDADEIGDFGDRALDVEFDALDAFESAGCVVVVDAYAHAVHACLACAGSCAVLNDGEAGERARVVDLEVGPDDVDAGGLEPLAAPVGEVATRRLLQRGKQIRERRIAELVRGEVVAQTREEVVDSDIGDELLEHGCALGIGDAVEVDLDGGDVRDVGGNGMRRGQLILAIGPRLLDVGERRPRAGVLGCLRLAQHRCERGEGFVEPQVVPPLHGDQVAEPHVRHLVQDGLGASLVVVVGHARPEDVILEERDGARVLHCACVELRHEELVVLAEGVGDAEVLVVEGESLLGLGEETLGVHELREGRPAVDPQRDRTVVVGVGVCPLRVRPRDQRDEVRAHDRGFGEAVHSAVDRLGQRVGDDLPVLGRGHGDRVGRLEIGLVEAGEHPLGVGGLELRVEIDGIVGGIDETVQPLTGV